MSESDTGCNTGLRRTPSELTMTIVCDCCFVDKQCERDHWHVWLRNCNKRNVPFPWSRKRRSPRGANWPVAKTKNSVDVRSIRAVTNKTFTDLHTGNRP
jgi:hypothetical protein